MPHIIYELRNLIPLYLIGIYIVYSALTELSNRPSHINSVFCVYSNAEVLYHTYIYNSMYLDEKEKKKKLIVEYLYRKFD